MLKKIINATVLVLATAFSLTAQSLFTLSGYVRDAETGENLVGANVYIKERPSVGGITNGYGFYSLSIEKGNYTVVFSYLGYSDKEAEVALSEDIRLNIDLAEGVDLEEVLVTARPKDENVNSTRMGTVDLPADNIKKLPAFMGEVDILKAIQLLPGVLSAGEGNVGFYVRGGGPDQNLVLLDEAVVYNSGHMLGFFSVFNADAIKNTTLIKGGMPATYGGRLSSVVDVQMKEGNDKHYQVDGGIGLVASRLTVQGPIVEDRSSFIVSGRRTYALDLAQPFLEGTDFDGTNYYFYDLNAKVNHRFSDKDRLYLSVYFGRDVLDYRNQERDFFFNMPYGNTTATLRWNHLFGDKLFMNTSLIFNEYDFSFDGGQGDFKIGLFSGVRDYNTHLDFDYYPTINHEVRFGINYTFHKLTPNITSASNGEAEFTNGLQPDFAHEAAVYIQDNFRINEWVSINAGLRFSLFTQLGPYTSSFTGDRYGKLEPVTTYTGLEPRLSLKWNLDARSSIKAGFSLANQYLHLVSNSTSTLPIDAWVPSTELVKPQRGIQYALGYFRNFADNQYETSVEVYYKDLDNQIDYRENYVSDAADRLEQEFVFGQGRSYGIELFLKKREGRLNGWIGYTLSLTERTFPDINDGNTFPAVYDRPHDLAVVANYALSKKWQLGGAFIFGTGNTYTPVQSLYLIGQDVVTQYGPRNSARIEDYHRLDLSATLIPNPESEKRFSSSWTFSIYNVYSRQNPFFTYYDFETDQAAGTARASAYKVSLFPIIPAITWNFKWKE